MSTGSELTRQIAELVREAAEAAGVEVVEISMGGSGAQRRIRIDIDRAGPCGVTLSDCKRVSELLSARLDSDDVIPFRYNLEVSSPGADRPLRTDDDFRRNAGRNVAVTTTAPFDGERCFRGRLVGLSDGCVVLAGDLEEPVRIPLDHVEIARQELEFSRETA